MKICILTIIIHNNDNYEDETASIKTIGIKTLYLTSRKN